VAAYQQFKSRHSTVLSVSLDHDQGKWEKPLPPTARTERTSPT
jgi:hypothetical protein